MRKILFIDYEKCTRCQICVLACSLEKAGTCNPSRARISVLTCEERGISVPIMCQHCEDPLCIAVCLVNAISRDKESGIVEINVNRCIGCKTCLTFCPFGAPSLDAIEGKIITCDLCGGDPVCAQWCPTGAIQYIRADTATLSRRRMGMEKLAQLAKLVQS